MGNSTNNSKILYSLISELYKEINSFNEKTEFGKEKIISTLELFFLSDNYIPFTIYELTEKNQRFKNNIIIMLEQKKKYLSLEILNDLLERLNSETFKLQLKKIIHIIQNKQEDEVLKLYFSQNKDKIKKSNDFVRGGRIEGFDISYIKILGIFYEYFFSFKFKELLLTQENYKKFVNLESFKNYFLEFEDYFNLDKYNWKKESIQFFINFLINFKDSDGLGEIRQLFLFFLNSINNKKEIINEIVSKAKISDFIFNLMYGNYITMNFMNISKKFIWLFFGSEIKILEGKKTDDEYLSLDMFIEGSNNTFRSIFTKREIKIINIEIFLIFFKDKKLTIEQFKKEKNKITETKNKNELTIYIRVKNKIINFNNSFDLLLNEFINLKFFEEQNTNEEIRNIEQVNENKDDKNDENKIYDTKEIDDLKLELKKEKEINQKLVEKINKLENELNLEKMKNKEFEKQLINKMN